MVTLDKRAVLSDFTHLTTNLGRHVACNKANGKDEPMRVHPSYQSAIDKALAAGEIMVIGTYFDPTQGRHGTKLFLVTHP